MPAVTIATRSTMRKAPPIAILTIVIFTTLPSFAEKIKGDSTLKDNQPYGTKDKEHKHQGYDFSFDAQGKTYTCRTDPDHSVTATDFVVGAPIHYEIDKNKAEIKTPQNKKLNCKIVRAEILTVTR
jgi:hypothetical protein